MRALKLIHLPYHKQDEYIKTLKKEEKIKLIYELIDYASYCIKEMKESCK